MNSLVKWYENLPPEFAYIVALDSASGKSLRDEVGKPVRWNLDEATPDKIGSDLLRLAPGGRVTLQARGPKGDGPRKNGPTITVPGLGAPLPDPEPNPKDELAALLAEVRNLLSEQRTTIKQLGSLLHQSNAQVISMAQTVASSTETSLREVLSAKVESVEAKADKDVALALAASEEAEPQPTALDKLVAVVGPEKIQEMVGSVPELAKFLSATAEAKKLELRAKVMEKGKGD